MPSSALRSTTGAPAGGAPVGRHARQALQAERTAGVVAAAPAEAGALGATAGLWG